MWEQLKTKFLENQTILNPTGLQRTLKLKGTALQFNRSIFNSSPSWTKDNKGHLRRDSPIQKYLFHPDLQWFSSCEVGIDCFFEVNSWSYRNRIMNITLSLFWHTPHKYGRRWNKQNQIKLNQNKPILMIKGSFIWYMLCQNHCRSFRKSVNHRSNGLFFFKCGASPAKPSAQVQSPVAPWGESHHRKMEGWKLDHFRFGARVSFQGADFVSFRECILRIYRE